MDKPVHDVSLFLRQFGYLQLIQMKAHYQKLISRPDFAHMKPFWIKGLEIINLTINEILSTADQETSDRPPDMD